MSRALREQPRLAADSLRRNRHAMSSRTRGSRGKRPGKHMHWASSDSSLEAEVGARITPRADGCWIWTGGHSDGYGMHPEARLVHRYVYETLVGPIPDGDVLHHLCEVKDCCNPAHLEPMTPGDHTAHHATLRRLSSETTT